MSIKMKTPISEVEKYLERAYEQSYDAVIDYLSFLGGKCVIEGRDRSQAASWIDQTGALRSSIGYVVVADGQIVHISDFKSIKEGAEGVIQGKTFAEQLAKNYKTGFALIVVAGMAYASYVEAMENKVVLASAETLASVQAPIIMNELAKEIERIYGVE